MNKVVSVIFPTSKTQHNVQYLDEDENAVKSIMDLVFVHNCEVFLLHGFTAEEIVSLSNIPKIVVKQKTFCGDEE